MKLYGSMNDISQIKSLLKSGDVAGAEALCKAELQKTPGDASLKMLFGTCRQLQGDEETFRRIHDELAPEMAVAEKVEPLSEKVSLWRKYHKLWLALIAGVLVLGGAAVVTMVGNSIRDSFHFALYAGPVAPVQSMERPGPGEYHLYAAPKYEDRDRAE